MRNLFSKKLFFALLALTLFSVICVLPYVLTIQADVINQIQIPLWILFVVQFTQSIILFSIAIALGLFFTSKIGFTLPLFTAILNKENYLKVLKNIWRISVISGVLVALAIYLLDPLFTAQGADISTHQNLAPVWQKLLAAFYGGITEEILLRLFLMTFFIWISMKMFKKSNPTNSGIIVSIVLTAVLFGIGHLPITASVTNIDSLVVTRAIVLNGIAGIVFGYLFWKKGLESAMISHFTADIFLLTLLPLIIK